MKTVIGSSGERCLPLNASRPSKYFERECSDRMQLDRDFKEFVASFIDSDVRFLIVGDYALAAHGASSLHRWFPMLGSLSILKRGSGRSSTRRIRLRWPWCHPLTLPVLNRYRSNAIPL